MFDIKSKIGQPLVRVPTLGTLTKKGETKYGSLI
jgi:hypothetical protein